MPDSQNSQSNQADQADQADAFTFNSNTANATSAANATSVVSPTTSVSSTMSPTLIMGVMGGCIGLLVIALIVVVVYFVVVKSCGANGDSGGDSGGSGGSGASCAAPSVTNDVLCTKNTDNTYSCVANCAQLKFPSGCSAKLNAQTSLCDITCSASGCNIDVFDANNPKTWVNLDSTGKCYGTAEVTGMVGSNTMYCQAVPHANGSYTHWATVNGTPKPSHLADGFLAVSGKTSTTSTTPSDWQELAYFCSKQATPDYPCTGLDVFYNAADDVSYYVACQADRGANTTLLATSAPTNSPNPFGPTVSATHYGAVLAMKDFPGVPPASSSSLSSSMQSTLAKPSKRKTVPGW